ncbi:MAG: lactate utilization protein C [Rhodospirillales bacterium]|nr:lactate utilization protein C [Rhodospirillales bacterium]MSP80602.1 lactate utilization protein C [Rhodospirillales bacterium]
MSRASRQAMLADIRNACTPRRGGAGTAAVEARLAARAPGPVPARARIAREGQIALFIAEAERVQASVARVKHVRDVPGAVAGYLARHNIEPRLKCAPDPFLRSIPWAQHPVLSVAEGKGEGDDPVGVTGAFAAVAETGTLVLVSGAASPTTLALVPPVHVAVVPTGRLLGTYEESWAALRARSPRPGKEFVMPRSVNWITGPSRTADIEQTLLLGAHGPQRLFIVLVDEENA